MVDHHLRRAGLVTILIALAGCTSPTLPNDEPYVVGSVESISPEMTWTTLLVEETPGSREPCGIYARVDGRTTLAERSWTGHRSISLEDIRVGDRVAVYPTAGILLTSCPAQAYAEAIVRVD